MAGDWIPMRVDLADDPAVISIAGSVGLPEYAVVGLLHRIWSWANVQLATANARGVSPAFVDRYLGVSGFAAAMTAAGWLVVRADGQAESIEFVNFERWNSQGAKKRILTARRVAKHAAKTNAGTNAEANATPNARGVRSALAKGEKRREEEEKNPPNPPLGGTDQKPAGSEPAPAAVATVPEKSHQMPPELDNPTFRESWAAWIANRREKRFKPYSERGGEMQLKALAKFGTARAVEAIENSIRNGWQGLFPEKCGPASAPAQFKTAAEREAERTKAALLFALESTNGRVDETQ